MRVFRERPTDTRTESHQVTGMRGLKEASTDSGGLHFTILHTCACHTCSKSPKSPVYQGHHLCRAGIGVDRTVRTDSSKPPLRPHLCHLRRSRQNEMMQTTRQGSFRCFRKSLNDINGDIARGRDLISLHDRFLGALIVSGDPSSILAPSIKAKSP